MESEILLIMLAAIWGNAKWKAANTAATNRITTSTTVRYLTVCQYTSTRDIFGFSAAAIFPVAMAIWGQFCNLA